MSLTELRDVDAACAGQGAPALLLDFVYQGLHVSPSRGRIIHVDAADEHL